MNIITLNKKDVVQFWKLRFCLLQELGEISTKTNLQKFRKFDKRILPLQYK